MFKKLTPTAGCTDFLCSLGAPLEITEYAMIYNIYLSMQRSSQSDLKTRIYEALGSGYQQSQFLALLGSAICQLKGSQYQLKFKTKIYWPCVVSQWIEP